MISPEYLKIFTPEQGNLLIRLLLAHCLADFALQTRKMVENKRWFSSAMALHIGVVFIITLLLGQNLLLAAVIAGLHWLTDGIKAQLSKKGKYNTLTLFVFDQLVHVSIIILIWAGYTQVWQGLARALTLSFANYNISLLLLGYSVVIWPIGYIIKFLTKQLARVSNNEEDNENVQNGGMRIGQFERIIILTFVLLQQYEAIGFLITGKSIIRFAGKDENLKSEYVLVGTMMSYAMSILVGVGMHLLMN